MKPQQTPCSISKVIGLNDHVVDFIKGPAPVENAPELSKFVNFTAAKLACVLDINCLCLIILQLIISEVVYCPTYVTHGLQIVLV